MSFSWGPLTLHLYGFLIGLAVFITASWAEFLAKQEKLNIDQFWSALTAAVVGGVAGARLYHVLTDISLYMANPWRALQVWQGGLSIIGAVIGAALAVWIWELVQHRPKQALVWFDLAALVVPVGQMIGRLGNWANQELYGSPTTLPWAIPIDAGHRLPGYENFATYHPLFAYEILALVAIEFVLWRLYRCGWKLGQAKFAVLYLALYCGSRFGLEFLRIDKAISGLFQLGVNQVLLLVVSSLAFIWLAKLHRQKQLFALLLVGTLLFAACSPVNQTAAPGTSLEAASLADRQKISLKVGDQQLQVEVVNSQASVTKGLSGRSEIGSDGMLFVMPHPTTTNFWMIDMKFDLDLIWIAEGKIVGVTANVPAPKSSTDQLPLYPSPGKVEEVLEVPAGTAAKHNWQVGTVVQLNSSSP